MSKVLNLIHDEHRSIAAVLHGMEYLMNQVRSRRSKIDPRVFRAMLYYLDTFCDRMHHPKEDRYLFAALKSRGAQGRSIIEELEKEHAEGAAALLDLERALLRYEEGGDGEFPAFARAVEKFTDGYWNHMRKEEDQVFPLARKLLTAEDWEAVDREFENNRDPIAAERNAKDYQRLFTRIVSLAPPPIGVGPTGLNRQ